MNQHLVDIVKMKKVDFIEKRIGSVILSEWAQKHAHALKSMPIVDKWNKYNDFMELVKQLIISCKISKTEEVEETSKTIRHNYGKIVQNLTKLCCNNCISLYEYERTLQNIASFSSS